MRPLKVHGLEWAMQSRHGGLFSIWQADLRARQASHALCLLLMYLRGPGGLDGESGRTSDPIGGVSIPQDLILTGQRGQFRVEATVKGTWVRLWSSYFPSGDCIFMCSSLPSGGRDGGRDRGRGAGARKCSVGRESSGVDLKFRHLPAKWCRRLEESGRLHNGGSPDSDFLAT